MIMNDENSIRRKHSLGHGAKSLEIPLLAPQRAQADQCSGPVHYVQAQARRGVGLPRGQACSAVRSASAAGLS